jgi:hypothetical protein
MRSEPLSRRYVASDVMSVPALARAVAVRAERRNLPARYALLRRLHHEFDEMPGLSMTASDAARLFGVRPDIAARILEQLFDIQALRRRDDGHFIRREESPR